MVIFFGTAFYGKIATHNEHWIETKFAHLCFIPLFPISSIVATEWKFRGRKGSSVETNKKSVIATYVRLFTSGLALLMFYYGASSYGSGGWTYYLAGIVFTAAWVYFCFFYGKATPEDIAMRDKLGSITGLYVLPHWLDHWQLRSLLDRFVTEYNLLYPGTDWKVALKTGHIEKEKRRLLFAIALFNCMLFDLPENDELYHVADRIYVLQTEVGYTPINA